MGKAPMIVKETKREIESRPPPTSVPFDQTAIKHWDVSGGIAEVYITESALEKMVEHCIAYSGVELEVMGFLIGDRFKWEGREYTVVSDSITTELDSSKVSVKFSDSGFERIMSALDQRKGDYLLLGWYHSHPGHTCFMSEVDIQTQMRMFKHPYQSAVVIDPINHQIRAYTLKTREWKRKLPEMYKQRHFMVVPDIGEKFIDFSQHAPPLGTFMGRQRELKQFDEMIERMKVVTVYGMLGTGKTSFLTKLLTEYRGETNVFWHSFTPVDTVRKFLVRLAEFLAEMGQNALQSYLHKERSIDIIAVAELLKDEFEGLDGLLFVDDFQKTDDRLKLLFSKLFPIFLYPSNDLHLIVASATHAGFYPSAATEGDGTVTEVQLSGLDKPAARELLAVKGIEGPEFEKIYRSTQGHPLSLDLIQSQSAIATSDNVEEFVQKELTKGLDTYERKLLQFASVFRTPITAHMLFSQFEENYNALEALIYQSLLQDISIGRYQIHEIVRDYFYDQLDDATRREYHREAADYYSQVPGAIPAVEAIHHYIAADAPARATEHLLQFGSKLLDEGYVEELVPLVEQLKTAETSMQSKLHQFRGEILFIVGEWDNVLEYYHQCKLLNSYLNSRYTQPQIHQGIGRLTRSDAEWERALSDMSETLNILQDDVEDDPAGVAEVYRSLAWMFWIDANYEYATSYYNYAAQLFETDGDMNAAARTYLELGNVYFEQDDYENAAEFYRKSTKVPPAPDMHELARGYYNLGNAFMMDEPRSARDCYAKAREYAESIGFVRAKPYIQLANAHLTMKEFQMDNAIRFLSQCMDQFENLNESRGIGYTTAATAVYYRQKGKKVRAMKQFQSAVNILKKTRIKGKIEAPFFIALLLLHLAELSHEMGRNEDVGRYQQLATKYMAERGETGEKFLP